MYLLAVLFALIVPLAALGPAAPAAPADDAPLLANGGFECGQGYQDQPGIRGMVPSGWKAALLDGSPHMVSAQMWLFYECRPNDLGVEKIEGHDSFVIFADETRPDQDFVAPPFDVAYYQQVEVTPGVDYSLTAWMTSLCGGSPNPSDCPQGAYIAKMAALDPLGGVDPRAAGLGWAEDRRPHVEAGWVNLVTATTAKSGKLTVFTRVSSPFKHHGNHVYADGVKLVRSPLAQISLTRDKAGSLALTWGGNLGPDIPRIPNGNFRISFEIQQRSPSGGWTPWRTGVGPGQAIIPSGVCQSTTAQYRIRAWAIQPAGESGSWPPDRFVGAWRESDKITAPAVASCPRASYLPLAFR